MSSNPSSSTTAAVPGGGGGGPCGACKFLRRKCVAGCVFAPYFDSDQGAVNFAVVHKVFGASNVSKLLLQLPVHKRLEAVVTICYEARARLRDPVYGCVAHIFTLQQQVVNLQAELSYFQSYLSTLELPTPRPPPPPPQPPLPPSRLSISDLPTTTNFPGTFNLSSLFVEPPATTQPGSRQFGGGGTTGSLPVVVGGDGGGGGELQELARELLHRRSSGSSVPAPCNTERSSLPPHDR